MKAEDIAKFDKIAQVVSNLKMIPVNIQIGKSSIVKDSNCATLSIKLDAEDLPKVIKTVMENIETLK